MYDTVDTIAAIATPIGESGIGIIRISGRDAYAVGDKIFRSKSNFPLAKRRDHSIQYGHIIDEKGHSIDEVLVLLMKGPKSYTAEDVMEIQCHGGYQSLEEILALILRQGARLANPGEFTERAFINGRIDLAQAEAVMDIIQAKSKAGLTNAVNQLEGKLSELVKKMRIHLTELITRLEVMVDYPEEDLEDITVPDIVEALQNIQKKLQILLEESRSGKMIRDGVMIAITGTPNAGKSSLLNQLVQEDRAIVTEIPGTTRDSIEVWITLKGVPICLIDTAGIRETADTVEQIGVSRAKKYLNTADMVIVMVDGSRPLTADDVGILEASRYQNAIIVMNKEDLPVHVNKKILSEYGHPMITVSAINGSGIQDLQNKIIDLVLDKGIIEGKSALLTNTRHIDLVRRSGEAINRALDTIQNNMPVDCAIVDIREAWELLGSITGDTIHDDIVSEIFSRFCLGK
ncbi:tRNA uridine-5-carboxymethylaminomethyl(34) synthesis GTPase MnmE [Megasphaera sueciensis]|jgi:tRNA modification GTPase|uniref:tRNA uridine-5-carboxymethylaminomethyl(34) synthesis GTPase MnmE n=1 Tax=Megasphaera sueciensis TaxID=349094 RepID=UPI003CFF022B|nr:tRNA uridine-5-carboxymethylaminomethyl(34) synthesis GTPase MnmE [Megasphaera sp.]